MKPLIYKNTLTKVNFSPPLHETQQRGYAYEIDKHFIHFYGSDTHLWVVSSGLTTAEGKSGTIDDWISATFGATNVVAGAREVGETCIL